MVHIKHKTLNSRLNVRVTSLCNYRDACTPVKETIIVTKTMTADVNLNHANSTAIFKNYAPFKN